ncbi:MAG TPA: hypothetical protein VFY53_04620 [Rhodoplanes sp.]|nr:hypothetical protein [Rhodoplanes sp.]
MATVERTSQRLVLQAGATTLVLDKESGQASLRRKALLWDRKPITVSLADICKIAVTPAIDRSCGFASCYTLLVTRSGAHLELPPIGNTDAEAAAKAMREFLGLE